MHSPFPHNNNSGSYQELSEPPGHIHQEEDDVFHFEDYESFRNPQYFSPGAPHIHTASWEDDIGPGRRDGETVGVTAPKAGYDAIGSRNSPTTTTTPDWLPYTLRWPCLTWILGFTAILELLVIIVHAISSRELGLANDDGSGSIVILSKFVPTLLAVAHGIILSILLNDIKRTQPFANLASPSGALGKLSLTWSVEEWWEALYVSLPGRGKKAGAAMLCASLAFILGFFVVSPFSSTLIVSQDVLFARSLPFSQLDLSSALPLRGESVATTYFRTVSNLLQNVTTSAWITEKYAVVPFWPSAMGQAPLGPIVPGSVGTWSAKTTVFEVKMSCEPMKLVQYRWVNFTNPQYKYTSEAASINLLSPSGCGLNLTLGTETQIVNGPGGTVWSTVHNTSKRDWGQDFSFLPLSIGGCNEEEFVFLSTRLAGTTAANATVLGQVCNTTYHMGDPTVTVTLSKSSSLVEVDEAEYSAIRKPIPNTVVDLPFFQRLFFSREDWAAHLSAPIKSTRGVAYGPAVMFSALYDFTPEKITASSSYVENLERVKRRFFGELLRDAFDMAASVDSNNNNNNTNTSGIVADTRRRVVVVPAVAIILEVSLLVQIVLLSIVLFNTRLSRRPLGLFADPAPPIRVAQLIAGEQSTLDLLDGLHNVARKDLDVSLSEKRYQLLGGQISLMAPDGPGNPSDAFVTWKQNLQPPTLLGSTKSDKQSSAFSTWPFLVLVFWLSATLIVIAYLYWYAETVGLHQTAFVYAFDLSLGGLDLGDLNPASLVTTLVAVSISLWWASLETTLRRIQPYLALSKTPITRSGSEAVSISYISSYLLWATWRAVRRSHWVLALVCTGAFLAEIFTIAMSSLWSVDGGTLPSVTNVTRQLELRDVPYLTTGKWQFTTHQGDPKQDLLSELFDNLRTSWIYGAAVQTSLKGSEPPWSAGGWSFLPYDLSTVRPVVIQNTGNKTETSRHSMNATVETSAIRGRLECSPYEHLDLEDSKGWLTEWDLRNSSQWRKDNHTSTKALTRAYELGLSKVGDNAFLFLDEKPDMHGNYTPFFTNNKHFQCCQNLTTKGEIGTGSTGYWSANLRNGSHYPDFADTWPANFTVKWIHGRPVEGYCVPSQYRCLPRLLWAEKPRMAALNCMPIIETANTSVTVSVPDGRVVNFALRDEPRPDENAWSHNFLEHSYTSITQSFDINITTSHGILFVTGLLGAADSTEFRGTDWNYLYTLSENLDDQTYNIRTAGVNVDLMTYAMLSLVDNDHEALLDPETLKRTAQQTFATLFQNFASTNVSSTTGGYVFQRVGEKLPDDLDGPPNKTSSVVPRADGDDNNDMVTLHISNAVELLKISTSAAWICLVILAYLIIVSATLMLVSGSYRKMLLRRINSIADVAVLMAGSQRLLKLARESEGRKNFRLDPETKVWLGWFADRKNGTARWGIEVVGDESSDASVNDGTATQNLNQLGAALPSTSRLLLQDDPSQQHQQQQYTASHVTDGISRSGPAAQYPYPTHHDDDDPGQRGGVEEHEMQFLVHGGSPPEPRYRGTSTHDIAPSVDVNVENRSFSDYFRKHRSHDSEYESLVRR